MTHAPKTIIEYEILDAKEAKKRTLKGSTSQMDGRVKLTILDKNKKLRLVHTQPFGSYVSNFGKILNYLFTGATNIGMKDTSGSATASNGYAIDLSSAIANENNYGIFIGDLRNATGFSTFTPAVGIGQTIQLSDYQLYRKLPASGSGVSPVTDTLYNATSVTAVGDNVLKVSRTFTCSRSAGVKVSEVGLTAKEKYSAKLLLLARDFVISKAGNYVQVLNGETLQVDYIFTITDDSSFTTNFLKILESLSKASAGASVQPKTTGASTALVKFASASTSSFARITSPATAAYGVIVGGTVNAVPTDSVPIPVVSDYKLNNQVSHANLAHGVTTAISLTAGSGQTKFGVYRDFTNNGTNNVYINEVGVVAKRSVNHHYLLNRSLFTSGDKPYVVVEPDKTIRIKVYYVFEIGLVIDLGVSTPAVS